MTNQKERLTWTAEVACAAVDQGLEPMSQEIIDMIRSIVPDTDEREIYEALRSRLP
jgi:hypothetical protein